MSARTRRGFNPGLLGWLGSWASSGARLMALRAGSPGGLTGQDSTHSPQPVQSST